MVVYNFHARFAAPIRNGSKTGTIRSPRGGRGHVKPGQGMQLFTGMRTTECDLLLRTICFDVTPVLLRWRPVVEFIIGDGPAEYRLDREGMEHFAIVDGFADLVDMERFWAERHPGLDHFHGSWIRWQPPSSDAAS